MNAFVGAPPFFKTVFAFGAGGGSANNLAPMRNSPAVQGRSN